MASKTAPSKPTSKASAKKPADTAKTPTAKKAPAKRKSRAKASRNEEVVSMPRATSSVDDKEVLLSGGARNGTAFGRCGGRILSSRSEQQVCDQLSRAGVTHSHAPRHFEVKFENDSVAAYAPMIVLRVRGREGKTVVIEAADRVEPSTIEKIQAFRREYGVEFYLCMIAPEEILDDIPISAYDEAAATEFAHTLINRLAE